MWKLVCVHADSDGIRADIRIIPFWCVLEQPEAFADHSRPLPADLG